MTTHIFSLTRSKKRSPLSIRDAGKTMITANEYTSIRMLDFIILAVYRRMWSQAVADLNLTLDGRLRTEEGRCAIHRRIPKQCVSNQKPETRNPKPHQPRMESKVRRFRRNCREFIRSIGFALGTILTWFWWIFSYHLGIYRKFIFISWSLNFDSMIFRYYAGATNLTTLTRADI